MNTVETENPEFTHRLFNGQEKNCFAPELILGSARLPGKRSGADVCGIFI